MTESGTMIDSKTTRLGIIAGKGELPRQVIAYCNANQRDYFVLALEGQTEAETVANSPHAWVSLGQVGYGFDTLRAAGVQQVVFAGAVKRPSLFSLKLDGRGAALLAKIGMKAMGDDGLLRAVSEAFESEGFTLIGVDQLLHQNTNRGILSAAGKLGRYAPDALAMADLVRGYEVAKALGKVDVGQSVVVQQGIVLGVEAIEGTDALIDRTANLRRDGMGGVLVKILKPGQDRRFDLPTIGSTTVTRAATAGLRGIAIEAAQVIILDHDEAILRADAAGLFIFGVENSTKPS